VSAGLGSVDQPARASSIPRLVPPDRLAAAISLNQVMFNGSAVVGPALGGVVLATSGIAAAYLLDLVSFLAAIAALLLMAPIPPARGTSRASIGAVLEGLRFARSRRELLAAFVVDVNAMVFGSPRALFPALALDVFRVGPAGVGFMASAAGIGALVAALFTGWTGSVRRPGRAVLVAVAIWGVGITAFGLATFSFPLALLCLAIASGADVVSAVLRSSMIQVLTPDALRGRVSSIHILVVTGGPRIGDAESAAVASLVGPGTSVVVGGIATLVGLGAIHLAMPEFSRLEGSLDEAEPG
jgi:predicted MFS family arabinose efflux permease